MRNKIFTINAKKIKTAIGFVNIPIFTSCIDPHPAIKIVDGRLMARAIIWSHFLFINLTPIFCEKLGVDKVNLSDFE